MKRTTFLAVLLMVLSLGAPLTLIYASQPHFAAATPKKWAGRSGVGRGGTTVWLTTPAFTITDAEGDNRVFVAALKMRDRVAATRICRWMPVIRDRIQLVIAGVNRRMPVQGTPTLSIEKRRLHNSLRTVLESAAPSQVAFVDAAVSPGSVLKGGTPALCDGNLLDDRRSRMFLG